MANSSSTGISRIIRATGYSWKGMRAAYRHEAAFRQELGLTIFLFPLAFLVGSNVLEVTLRGSGRELALVAAQDCLVQPRSRFTVERVA